MTPTPPTPPLSGTAAHFDASTARVRRGAYLRWVCGALCALWFASCTNGSAPDAQCMVVSSCQVTDTATDPDIAVDAPSGEVSALDVHGDGSPDATDVATAPDAVAETGVMDAMADVTVDSMMPGDVAAADVTEAGDGADVPFSGWTVGAVLPAFSLRDMNMASATSGRDVSPRAHLGAITAWYFGHAT